MMRATRSEDAADVRVGREGEVGWERVVSSPWTRVSGSSHSLRTRTRKHAKCCGREQFASYAFEEAQHSFHQQSPQSAGDSVPTKILPDVRIQDPFTRTKTHLVTYSPIPLSLTSTSIPGTRGRALMQTQFLPIHGF